MLEIRRSGPPSEEEFREYGDGFIYQTPEWMEFLTSSQGGEPIWAEVRDGGRVVGRFTGMKVSRMGVPVLGSPFPGWTTMHMGFNLLPGVPRMDALRALESFAVTDLGCLHFELVDRLITTDEATQAGYEWNPVPTFVTDLRESEEALFASMKESCRRCVRQSAKRGVTIEEAEDTEGFAEEYYDQLKDVFAKQGLVPTYPQDRVTDLIRAFRGTGRLLLLRALSPEGQCIGTGIYPGMGRLAQFWGNASYREHQRLRPNEALHWQAMRYWKERGAVTFDWGGGGDYKLKYGCTPTVLPWVSKSRFRALHFLRDKAQEMYGHSQRLKGRLRGLHRSGPLFRRTLRQGTCSPPAPRFGPLGGFGRPHHRTHHRSHSMPPTR